MSRQTGSQASDGWGVPLRPPRGKNLNAAPSKGENQGGAGSGRGGGGGGAGGAGGGGGGGGGHNKCYKCKKAGHKERDCPENNDNRQGDKRAPNSGGSQGTSRGLPTGANQRGSGGVDRHQGSSMAAASSQSSSNTAEDKKKEDTLLTNFQDVKRTAVANPYRPNYGTRGDEAEILTNYFAMTPDENLVLHCYTITFVKSFKANGEEFADPKGPKLKQIVRLMLKSQDFDNRRNSIVTDFQQSLISLEKLPGEIQNQRVEYYHEADGAARANAQTYDLHIVPVRDFEELRIADLIAFLTSTTTTAQYPAKVLMVQALNTLIGHHTNSNQTTTVIGGKRAFPSNALDKSLGGDLIAKRGFFSSVRLASHRPLVNVNISHGAFYNAIGLAAIMDNWRVEEFVRRDQWEELETFVKGLKVKTNYLKDGSGHQITMVKTISGFAHEADGYGQRPRPMVPNVPFGSPFQVFFLLKDSGEYAKVTSGRDRQYHPSSAGYENREYWKTLRDRGPGFLSVAEFFGEKHGVWTHNREIYPVVNVGSKKDPIYIPAEACTVEPGQLSRSKLNPEQTTAMLNFAKLLPNNVVGEIRPKGLETMGLSPRSPQMSRFGVNVDENMVKIVGRILSPPQIEYGDKNLSTSAGSWNLLGNPQFKTSKPLQRWEFLAINDSKARHGGEVRVARELEPSMNLLIRVLNSLGVVSAKKPKAGRTLDITSPNDKLLSDTIKKAASEKLDILFVILPEKETVLYNKIKKLGDVTWGVQTICVVGKEKKFYGKNVDQYCANVALKFNLKLDGTNHVLSAPSNQQGKRVAIISENKTMVVGIDVTHPGPGSANPSIAAMVASVDADLAVWPADLRVQIRTRQEMVTFLGKMLRTRLDLWRTKHTEYPENILVYRDGVSESQYEQVLDKEFSLMQKTCKELYEKEGKPSPRFTIVIVGKRHHTRFFPQAGSKAGDKTGNPKCGLVVDRGITEARNWDFFLQSHTSHLGTARPSHYYVLWDEIFTNPTADYIPPRMSPADLLEQVTHDMCYLFGRATKAVSLCPPVYYADIACERAGRYVAGISYDSASGKSESEWNDADRERRQQLMQKDITIHPNLKNKMFYI